MTAGEIEEYFPAIKGRFEITSEPDEEYNCIAWSVNDTKQWWWPTPPGQKKWPGKYWPPGIPHDETLAFGICSDRGFEPEYDKIAIYADLNGVVTHAARWWQEDRGWSSKLGEENDICHHVLESLEGPAYGSVFQIMRRARALR